MKTAIFLPSALRATESVSPTALETPVDLSMPVDLSSTGRFKDYLEEIHCFMVDGIYCSLLLEAHCPHLISQHGAGMLVLLASL